MNNIKRSDIFVQYRNKIKPYNPIVPRHYTITHSDETSWLFVFIGDNYANDKINKSRDEVRLKWENKKRRPTLTGWVLLDNDKIKNTKIRDEIFKREMPKALQAFVHADRFLLNKYPRLYNANIYIHFKSKNEKYNKTYNFGKVRDYKL